MIPGAVHPQPLRVTVDFRRVLLVDEALPVRRKLMEILHRAGVAGTEMAIAETAEQAMERFARDRPHVVFTELVGEDASQGLEMVLEMLSADPQVKIVLLTAEDPSSTLVRQAVRAGVFAVLSKPLRHEKVRQVLAEIEAEEGGIMRFR